jgi:secretion/DNA translocation related CpaE-like protein
MDIGTDIGTRTGRVIAVVGACGGAGTSTLAAGLARGLRRDREPAALVDLAVPGVGVDVLLGIEDEPGARWPDLAAARGDVDGAGLLTALPRWGTVPVLSGSRHVPERPDDAVVLDVCTGLLRADQSVVLDLPLPGAWSLAATSLAGAADVVLLAAPLTAPGLAGALAVSTALAGAGAADVRLVARRPAPGRVDEAALERATGLPVVATLPWDRRQGGAVERGEGPAVGRRSALGRGLAELAGAL